MDQKKKVIKEEIDKKIDVLMNEFRNNLNNLLEFIDDAHEKDIKGLSVFEKDENKNINFEILNKLKVLVEKEFNIEDLSVTGKSSPKARAVFCQIAKKISPLMPISNISKVCYNKEDSGSVLNHLRGFTCSNILDVNQIKGYLNILAKYEIKDPIFEFHLIKLENNSILDLKDKENHHYVTLNKNCFLVIKYDNKLTGTIHKHSYPLAKNQRLVYKGKDEDYLPIFEIERKKFDLKTNEGTFKVQVKGYFNPRVSKRNISVKDLEEIFS